MHLPLIDVLIWWSLIGVATRVSAVRLPTTAAVGSGHSMPQASNRLASARSNYKSETMNGKPLPAPPASASAPDRVPQQSKDLLPSATRTSRTTSVAFLPMTSAFSDAFNTYKEATNDNNNNGENRSNNNLSADYEDQGHAIYPAPASMATYANAHVADNIDNQQLFSNNNNNNNEGQSRQFADYQQLQFHQMPGSGFVPTTLTTAGKHFATLHGLNEATQRAAAPGFDYNEQAGSGAQHETRDINETNERITALPQIGGGLGVGGGPGTSYIAYADGHQGQAAFDDAASSSAAYSDFTPRGEIDYEINSANYDAAAVDDNRLVPNNAGARFVTMTPTLNEQNANNANALTPRQHYHVLMLEQQQQLLQQQQQQQQLLPANANANDNGNEHVFQIRPGMHGAAAPRGVIRAGGLHRQQQRQQHQHKLSPQQGRAFDQQYTDSSKHYLHDLKSAHHQHYKIKPRAFYYSYGSADFQSNANERQTRQDQGEQTGSEEGVSGGGGAGDGWQAFHGERQENLLLNQQSPIQYVSEELASGSIQENALESPTTAYHQFSGAPQEVFHYQDLNHDSPSNQPPPLPPVITKVKHTPQSMASIAGVPLRKHVEVTKHVAVPHYHRQHVPFNQTVPIEIPKAVISAIPRPVPIKVPVTKTVAIPQLEIVKIPVEKVKPIKVERPVPYLVEKRVPYQVEHQVAKPVYYPYPIRVPLVTTVIHKVPATHRHHHPHQNGYLNSLQRFSAHLQTKLGHLG